MNVLALDLGTHTGWALHTDGTVLYDTAVFRPGRYQGGGMRYVQFRSDLAIHHQVGLDAVYFEEVRRHAGVTAAHVYGGFLAVLSAYCEQHNIPYAGVPVGTIKRHWTGKGNASKAAMIAAARARGYEPSDDNQADALALLDYALVTWHSNDKESV